MRISIHWLLILLVPLIAGCSGGDKSSRSLPPKAELPPPLIQLYFTGTTRLVTDTNAAPWVSMAELPASQALWRQTLEKLARAPHQLISRRTAATNDFALRFQELIADAVRAESFVEVTGDTNQLSEIEFVVRLPPDRAEFWRTNLLTIAGNWVKGHSQALPANSVGWELKTDAGLGVFRFSRVGDWTMIGWGREQLPLQDEFRKRIVQTGRPKLAPGDAWAEIVCDGSNLAAILSSPGRESAALVGLESLSAVNLALARRGSDLRLSGNLIFRDPFSWQLEPWQIPTNLIHDPIISFTAVQGTAPLLRKHQSALGLTLDPLPNQLFVWAGLIFPVQTMAAAPLKDPAAFIRSLAPQLMNRFNSQLYTRDAGSLVLGSNSSGADAILWKDIPPFVTPYLTSADDPAGHFLLAGIHPNWPETSPAALVPLFQYVSSRTNVVYYDWEIAAELAWSRRNVVNIFRHIFELPCLGPDAASIVCLNSISNRLGNTVTEVSRANSNRLDIIRQGPVCLTGLELMALAHWLESSSFPLGGIDLTARTNGVVFP